MTDPGTPTPAAVVPQNAVALAWAPPGTGPTTAAAEPGPQEGVTLKRDGRTGSTARLALTKAEAAFALGVSVDFFERHVMHELRIVRRGRRRLIPMSELEKWLDATAAHTLP